MYGLTVTTAPTIEPITTANIKVHCEIPSADTAHDTYLDGLVQAAREAYELRTGRALIHRTLTLKLDGFPTNNEPIYLPQSPLSSVTSISYVDTDGTGQTWTNTNYTALTTRDPGQVVLAYNATWPAVRWQAQAVTIVYVAGYGAAASSIPMRHIHAIKLLVRHWFEQRATVNVGNIVNDMPQAFEMLCEQARVADDFISYGVDHYA